MPRLSTAIFLALVVWWGLLVGCANRAPTRAEVQSDTLVWSDNVGGGKARWLSEARRRFDNPFVFVCHGDSSSGVEWWVSPDRKYIDADVEAVGRLLHDLMPDRDVVLVCCNAKGVKPRLPRRVWYSPNGIVWSTPGKSWRDCWWDGQGRTWGVGNVFQLVEGTED